VTFPFVQMLKISKNYISMKHFYADISQCCKESKIELHIIIIFLEHIHGIVNFVNLCEYTSECRDIVLLSMNVK